MSDDLLPAEPVPPLAEKLRPRTLDEVVGQQHLIGPNTPLRIAVEGGKPHSMLLWGAPIVTYIVQLLVLPRCSMEVKHG